MSGAVVLRLSGNQTVSCAHCHDLVAKAGTDGLPKSRRIDDGFDDINTLTVFNSAYNRMLMWNGRWRTLEEQAEGVMNNPRHMGGPWEVVLPRIEADADFAARFKASYGQVTREAVKEALATFERTLVTPNAPFDRHLRGDANALDEDQKSGWNLFQSYGCIACHQGQNLGGNLFAKLGVFKDYFAGRKDLTEADLGRYAVTKQDSDKHVFRVPSLRNVARTGPWFHDGSQATLDDAVRTMAKHQLGRKLPDEDVRLIVHFLEGLTGEWQGKPL